MSAGETEGGGRPSVISNEVKRAVRGDTSFVDGAKFGPFDNSKNTLKAMHCSCTPAGAVAAHYIISATVLGVREGAGSMAH